MHIGDVINDRYEVNDFIAAGGEGDVVRADDQDTGTEVAIKQLCATPDDPHFVQLIARFQRAARIRVGHPRVLDPCDYFEFDGEHYLVTPFVDGVDLEIHLRQCGGKCSAEQTRMILFDLADALAAVHRQGIVHRDIKPLNILIELDGHAKLIDFGIARIVHEKTITNGEVVGTPAWTPPEQSISPATVDPRTDIFSIGLVTWNMLTGVQPIQAQNARDARKMIQELILPTPRQLDPSIPPYLDTLCMRMLAKRPEERLSSAEEILQLLHNGVVAPGLGACPSCQDPLLPGASFCTACGARLNGLLNTIHCLACGSPSDQGAVCASCQRPFSPKGHRLHFHAGAVIGKTFRVAEGIYDVGRDILEPRDFSISRRHFHIACCNGLVQLQDAGSANGTYVAGRRADIPVQLVPDQKIVIAGNLATYLTI